MTRLGWIDGAAAVPVAQQCALADVARSTVYARRQPQAVPAEDLELCGVLDEIYTSRPFYGSRRMVVELGRRGYAVNRKRTQRLMRGMGLEPRQRRRWRTTTDSDHGDPIAPDRLQRRFLVSEPDRFWVADITAVWTLEGWLCLAAVLDLYDRQVVGWAMAGHMRTKLVLATLEMAVGRRQPAPGLIHHSAC